MSSSVWIAVAIFLVVDLIVVVWFLNRRNKIKEPEGASETFAAGGPVPPDPPLAPTVPPAPTPESVIDKNVQFTVYRPNTIVPQKWYPLVAFAHLSKRRKDAPPDEPDPIQEVQRQAAKILSDQPAKYEATKLDRGFSVPRKGMLTFVPLIEGCEFNPPSQTVLWQKIVHKVEFEMMAAAEFDGREVEGQMTVYLGNIILTEVPLRLNIDSKFVAPESEQNVFTPTSAEPYRKIFASYSHKDTAIVEDFENYVQSLGDEYLRDVRTLRAGQTWSEELEHMIRDASVFQLFWSSNSMISDYVKQEWEYALGLGREKFIRPVYWEEPLPKKEPELPPKALSKLHFYKLSIGSAEEEKRGGVIPPYPPMTASDLPPEFRFETRDKLPPDKAGPGGFMNAIFGKEDSEVKSGAAQGDGPMVVIAAVVLVAALTAAAIYIGYKIFYGDSDPDITVDSSPTPTPIPSVPAFDASPSPQLSPGTSPSPVISPSPVASPSPSPAPPSPSPTPKPATPSPSPTPVPIKPPVIRVNIAAPIITNQSQDGTFRLTVFNVGGDAARDIKITATLPSDLAIAGAKPEASVQGSTVFWSAAVIRPRDSLSFRVNVKLRRRLGPRERYRGKPTVTVTYLDTQGGQHSYPPSN